MTELPDAPLLALPVKVADRWMTACDVVALRLMPIGGTLPDVEAGAHIDVETAPGLVRQYSLTNQPGPASEYVIGVKLEAASRGGSRAVHERHGIGHTLRISPPRNNFRLEAAAPRSVLIAGGIGVTPLLSMARDLQARKRGFVFHYFARSVGHVAFRDVIDALGASCHLHLGLDAGATAASLASLLALPACDAHLYVCGPGPMLDLTRKIAADRGWSRQKVHFEYFLPTQGASVASEDLGFEVFLAKRGKSIVVPAGTTIIDALRSHGIDIATSCEQGICGTCLTGVLAGEPDHRDQFLDEQERSRGDRILPCVSRSRSAKLVLDL